MNREILGIFVNTLSYQKNSPNLTCLEGRSQRVKISIYAYLWIRHVPIDEDYSRPDAQLNVTDDFGSAAHSVHIEDADNGADDLFNEANAGLPQDQLIQQTAITSPIADVDASQELQSPPRKSTRERRPPQYNRPRSSSRYRGFIR
uniref:Uncharacterized protein n=1 Tax=Plectus sambesii TaxID=2011161 RepID=A0A914WB16_9BILA